MKREDNQNTYIIFVSKLRPKGDKSSGEAGVAQIYSHSPDPSRICLLRFSDDPFGEGVSLDHLAAFFALRERHHINPSLFLLAFSRLHARAAPPSPPFLRLMTAQLIWVSLTIEH